MRKGSRELKALSVVSLCMLAACAGPNEFSEKRPVFLPLPPGMGLLAQADAEIEKGQHENRSKPLGAIDDYLAAAQTAERQLHRNPLRVIA